MSDAEGPTVDEQVANLQRLTRSLEEAQRLAHLGSWDWDIATGSLRWSDEVFRIFGLDPNTVTPTYDAFILAVHADDRDRVAAAVDAAVASPDAPYSVQHRIVRSDGSIRHVREIGEVTRDEEGVPVRMLGTVLDVTERVESETRMRESQQLMEAALKRSRRSAEAERAARERQDEFDARKRAFVAALSHELRTPLTIVRGVGETLARGTVDPAMQQRLVERLLHHTRRLSTLIDDLLLVAHAGGARTEQHSVVELHDLVRDEAEAAAPEHRLTLRLEPVRMSVDVVSCRRAVHALVDNAVRYAAESGPIDVRLCVQEGGVAITVSDRGPGIPAALRDEVFEPFARGRQVVAHSPGAGIGLTIASACAQAHGGDVRIEDRHGGGTIVTMRLRGDTVRPTGDLQSGHGATPSAGAIGG